jgi:acetyl esterase
VTRIPEETDAPTRALLDFINEAQPAPLHTMTAVEARAEFAERRVRADIDKIDIARIEDRTIPGPAGEIPVRLYATTTDTSAALPVLVFYHGGGFVIGDLDSHDSVCRRIAAAGDCLVVAVDYRLAPEHAYPAAVEDSLAALAWVADNATEIGGDPTRLAVGGDSAGGNLSATVAQEARNNGGPALKLQVLIYPAVDRRDSHDSYKRYEDVFPIDRPTIEWFYQQYYTDPARTGEPWAAPGLVEDLSGLAPAIVLTAGLDPLCDEGEDYAKRLNAAGVAAVYHSDPGTIHGYMGMGKFLPHCEQNIARIGEALKAAFNAGA